MAYETTTVDVSKSQEGIRKLLVAYGCDSFAFAEGRNGDQRTATIAFQSGHRKVRMSVPLKEPDPNVLRKKVSAARSKTRDQIVDELLEQEGRRIWRVLHWNLKTRMEAIQEQVETFEEAFLAHLIVEETGQTIYEALSSQGSIDLGKPLLALPAGD